MIVLEELWWTRRICMRLWPVDRSLQPDWMSRRPSHFQQTIHFLHWKTAVSRFTTSCTDLFFLIPKCGSICSLKYIFDPVFQWYYHTSAVPLIPQEVSCRLWQPKTCWEACRTQKWPANSSSERNWWFCSHWCCTEDGKQYSVTEK